MTQPERKLCIAKVGQPDERNGMAACGAEVQWVNAGGIAPSGAIATYTGWRHVDPPRDLDHGAVPKGWV